MLILALDSASHLCAAAVFDTDGERVLSRAVEDIGRGHAERMMAVIDRALSEAGVGYADLGRIAVTVGPGSFTGVRVGVATARGLALALGLTSVGISSLHAIAAPHLAAAEGRPVFALFDARRNEIYGQLFASAKKVMSPAAVLDLDTAAAMVQRHAPILVGSGSPLVASHIRGGEHEIVGTASAPEIGDVARLAASVDATLPPQPLYLRAPDAKPQAGFALARRT
ncbi:tRNA (adenosine(37)-N6)-threonylcarbamoyltransferase complex dimerization subunit type 1 TsaB [Pararhizobium haloflavum]|uniref:tRNA (adenosine(37)-N6)-threonylcarbamoyltransferase complex dimerization subunit type 1 TsaB n=1 Tax=Pararhizobium haloflavum TaxID=2037914 RepID=UPI000C177DA4|nr:tRNA (adenosine(37)-N6)-threonylcarbamoyltransferase complex dimerization subunit type 1 TsaB [Pararhizobium haloflavum]